MARRLFYVFDDEAEWRDRWRSCNSAGCYVRAFRHVKTLVEALDRARADVVVLDVVDESGMLSGLGAVKDVLEREVSSVVLLTAHGGHPAVAEYAQHASVVAVYKSEIGSAALPTEAVIQRMRDEKPTTYLALRFAEHVRRSSASLVGETGGEATQQIAASLAGRDEDEEERWVNVFARNAMRHQVQAWAAGDALAADVYQFVPATARITYGNILRHRASEELRIILHPVCDVHGAERPPHHVLTFRCWTAGEFAREVEQSWKRIAAGGPHACEAVLAKKDFRLADRDKLIRALFKSLGQPHTQREKLEGRVRDHVCRDDAEWCYVLPALSATGVLVVDFTQAKSMLVQDLASEVWEVLATVEREWALHMLHKFSRWIGRLGVQDIDHSEACRALVEALLPLTSEIAPA